jgi:hypothetical protein
MNASAEATYDLSRFPFSEMTACGANLRRCAEGTATMEAAARRVVEHLYSHFRSPDGARACVLVRFYKTHAFGDLPSSLKAAVPAPPPRPQVKCLTLLASVGDEPAWNGRVSSVAHRVIPLPSEQVVERAPMVAQLVRQFGFDLAAFVRTSGDLLVDDAQKYYNVFHVPDARGSPHIPAQESFVLRYGVRSVLGFGGLLPSGDLFAVIMFSKTPISREVAEMFRTVSLHVKMAVIYFKPNATFDER